MNPVTLSSVYVASKSSGKPAKSLFVAVVLFVMGVSASAAPKPSVAELAAITERGQMLAEYDTAAWKATDALMVAHPKRLLRSAILFECDGPVHVPRLGCERRAGIPIPGICSILSSHGRGATMKTLGFAGISLFLFAVAWMCLFQPQRIQTFALSVMREGLFPSRNWVKTAQYIYSLRACGVIALLMSLVLAWAVIQNLRS
jgi:hypothetical protein